MVGSSQVSTESDSVLWVSLSYLDCGLQANVWCQEAGALTPIISCSLVMPSRVLLLSTLDLHV